MLGLCLKIEHEIEPFGRYLSLRRHDTYPMVMKHGNEKSTMAIVDYWRASPPPALPPGCSKAMSGKTERFGGTQQCCWSKKLGQWVRLSNGFGKDHSFAELAMVYFPIGETHHGWGIYWKYVLFFRGALEQIHLISHIFTPQARPVARANTGRSHWH